jgi:hypothetical protein
MQFGSFVEQTGSSFRDEQLLQLIHFTNRLSIPRIAKNDKTHFQVRIDSY